MSQEALPGTRIRRQPVGRRIGLALATPLLALACTSQGLHERRGHLCVARASTLWEPAFANKLAATCDGVAAQVARDLGLPAVTGIEVELLNFSPIVPGPGIEAYATSPSGRIILGAPTIFAGRGKATIAHEMCHVLCYRHRIELPFLLEEALAHLSEVPYGGEKEFATSQEATESDEDDLAWLAIESVAEFTALPRDTAGLYLQRAIRAAKKLGVQRAVVLGGLRETDWREVLTFPAESESRLEPR